MTKLKPSLGRHFVRFGENGLSKLLSSSPFHLRNRSFLLVTSVAVSSAEYCTLCPGGEQVALPEKRLDFQGRLEVYNCTALDEFATSPDADSDQCADIRGISSICGCPVHGNGCRLCPDGSAVTEPKKRLPFPEDFLGNLVPPTCAFFEAAVGYVNTTSGNCKDTQLISTLCGCPISEDACIFCPDASISSPQKDVSDYFHMETHLGFIPTTCETVEAASYRTVQSGTSSCGEFQLMNYLCGCNGNGDLRLALLEWLPRISAVLSILGSSCIIHHVLKDRKRRRTPYHQLVLSMSLCDVNSSIWWSLSTLPKPATNVYTLSGAKGNEALCTAQGFFIQLGLTSPFFNLSLAIYYLLVVSFGWSELKVKKVILWMHVVPLLCGLGLAFGGLPFYGPQGARSFCYIEHQGSYRNAVIFLVVPICTVILFATSAMVMLFRSVYRREKASSRWASKEGSKLSRKVFWQAFWYLTSFYVSWPIVVVSAVVEGSIYTYFWFQCLAMFLTPIQGFLNFIVYFRPRAQRSMGKKWSSCFSLKFFSSKPTQATSGSIEDNNVGSSSCTKKPSATNVAAMPIYEEGDTLETPVIDDPSAGSATERAFADERSERSVMSEPSVYMTRCADQAPKIKS